jgi:flagellar hook-basal body complex protein FliE
MLMGSDSEVANFGAIVGETTAALKEALHSSYAELLVDVNKMNNTAGVEEEFSKMLAGAIEKVGEKSTDAASDVKSMKDDMITYFDDLIPEVNQFAEDYAKNI